MSANRCNACQSENVSVMSCFQKLIIRGVKLGVYRIDYSECQNCHREFLTTDQIKETDKRVKMLKKDYENNC